MKSYMSYLAIEKKPSFKGIPLADLLVAVIGFVGMLLVGAFLMVIGIYSPYWFGFSLFSFLAGIIFLKARSTKGHPAFFISYFSYIILQPRKLIPAHGKLSLRIRI